MKQNTKNFGEFLLVGDGSSTDQAIVKKIIEDIRLHLPGVNYQVLSGTDFPALENQLKSFGKGLILLTTIGEMKDSNGKTIQLRKVLKGIVNAGDFIVMSMEDAYLEHGVLGGYVTSGYAQGKSAASLASRILEGESPALIELVQDSPNEYMFNYPQLTKLGISISKLPPQSIILDRPRPLYEEYKYELLSIIAFLVFQTLIIAILTDSIIKRKKAESALQASKDNLEIQIGERTEELRLRNKELQKAFNEIKTLRGIIPICSHCKNIRDDAGSWLQLETYISEHSDALFSHGICEKCLEKHYPEMDHHSSK